MSNFSVKNKKTPFFVMFVGFASQTVVEMTQYSFV